MSSIQPTFEGFDDFEETTKLQENATRAWLHKFYAKHAFIDDDIPIVSALIMNARLIDALTARPRDTSRQFDAYAQWRDKLYELHPEPEEEKNPELSSLLDQVMKK